MFSIQGWGNIVTEVEGDVDEAEHIAQSIEADIAKVVAKYRRHFSALKVGTTDIIDLVDSIVKDVEDVKKVEAPKVVASPPVTTVPAPTLPSSTTPSA